jgi:hypothetical protein
MESRECDHIYEPRPSGIEQLSVYEELLKISPPASCRLCGYEMSLQEAWEYMDKRLRAELSGNLVNLGR